MSSPETFNSMQFEQRKRSHIEFALHPDSQTSELSGLEGVRLVHDALPELDFSEVRIATPLWNRALATPFFVAGMTAGHAGASEINLRFARACEKRGWVLGIGSQRRELESALPSIDGWAALRAAAPNAVLIGNLGLSQAIRARVSDVQRLVRESGAQAIAIHLNSLQEVMQSEGTPQFRGGVRALAELVAGLEIPVVLKETGNGFSEPTLEKIRDIPFAAIDVAGLGGTHWGRIEGFRAAEHSDALRATAARTFADWGVSTVDSVRAAVRTITLSEIWATGGVRTGLDAAKLIALGAKRVGFARPALEAALIGAEALDAWMEQMEFELKTALFCTGCADAETLRGSESRVRNV